MWRRRSDTPAHRRKCALNHVGISVAGKSTADAEVRQYRASSDNRIEVVIRLPRKSAKHIVSRPVPQTDTRGRVEYTKALERFTVKELGKLTPYLRNKGSRLTTGAENRSRQLFNKNTGLCKV